MSVESSRAAPPAADTRIPEEHWRPIVAHIAQGPDHLVVIDDDWSILAANEAYTSTGAGGVSASFLYGTTPESRSALLEAMRRGLLDGSRMDVARPVRGGTRVVRYSFRRSDSAWVVMGRDETDKLELLGQMTSIVDELESRILSERQEIDATLNTDEDALTSLPGKKGLERGLDLFEKRRARDGVSYALILLDLDHFADLNSVHGHVIGDDVLRRVGKEIAAAVREGDFVARLESDEFAVIVRGVDLQRALYLADRLRRAVGGARMPPDVIRVETSVGVAAADAADGPEGRDILALGREALQKAKAAGRNCTRAAQGEVTDREHPRG